VRAAPSSPAPLVVRDVSVARGKPLAITFDDGPSRQTPTVLDVLRRRRARATFFVQGHAIPGNEDILRRIAAEGHELGNHLYSHPHPSGLSLDHLEHEIARTNQLIRDAVGAPPTLLRPPYGEDAERLAGVGGRLGLSATVLWSIDSGDWAETSPEEIGRRVLAGARPGGIVLLHDGRHDRSSTLRALPHVLDGLRRQRFRFVTVSELLAHEEDR
jgi:peptidoglycan-N-acetylglucosamine deacetylase